LHCGPGVKGGWCVRLTTLPTFCAIVMKSGNPNFLEPSEPLQPCNGTALPSFVSWKYSVEVVFMTSMKEQNVSVCGIAVGESDVCDM